MMLDFMDDYCESENHDQQEKGPYNNKSAFDFLYLPMDFRTHFNKGYAFVNFTNPRAASKFWKAKDNQKWDYFQSKKIRQIAPATIQGREALERRFRKSEFCCEFEEYLPISFCPARDGSNGLQSCGTNIGRVMIGSTNNY
uniref:Mei2-like C-terminal RNA recognition motif domain-containing protein n=1 Tax=Cannabis sativa TaxID=3483 RepID=A0A803Q9Q9_CANSA